MRPIGILFLSLLLFSYSISIAAEDSLQSQKQKRPSVGLVLSGGGAKGFAYVGLLKVIREAGLPVDYIGGSSIGSIIGALYALGYHPDSIAAMIRKQNWNDLLKDIPNRKFKAYEEKQYGEKTIVRLPIKNKTLAISSSMYQGQEIDLLLNYYFSPAYNISDFKKFPIPFLCMGTNLLTGDQVILDHGYLPAAVRASMSIPGYFSPTEYEGYYLVDGGVVNNYPVKEVKEMGAQIIVGGDVQSGLYSTREELNSITAVLDQITSFSRIGSNKVGDSLTDLKVRFHLPYGMMDFEKYDSIMAFGERVAREHFDEIKHLADSLNTIEFKSLKKVTTRPLDSVWVDSIIIRGSNKMPRKYFSSIFRKSSNTMVSMKNLQSSIRMMYGSGFFERVSYSFDQQKGKNNLVINADEGGPGALSAGIHFDNDYGVCFIISGNLRNIPFRNSKVFVDANISFNPRLRTVYLLGLGGKASLGLRADFYNFKFDTYDGKEKLNQIIFSNNLAAFSFRYTFRNMVNLEAGAELEYFKFAQNIELDSTLNPYSEFSTYGTVFMSLSGDSRDRPSFANKGVLATARFEYVMPFSKKFSADLFDNAALFYLKYDQWIPLSRKFVLQPGVFAGAAIWDKNIPPLQHIYGFGGLSSRNYLDQVVPFTGLHFIQKYGFYAWITRVKLQYNPYRKFYATARIDLGSNEAEFEDLFKGQNFLAGYGLTAGYDSFLGPVELTLMSSNVNANLMVYVSIGFSF